MIKKSENIDIILLKSKKLKRNGNLQLAKELLQTISLRYPHNSRIKKFLLELDHLKPNEKPSDHFNKLLYFYNQKDFKNALLLGQKSILKFPNDFNIKNIYGLIQSKFKNYNLAINFFKDAIKLNSDFALPYHNLGNIYITLGKASNAIECFKKAINIDSKNYMFFEGLGRAYYSIKDNELAIINFYKSLSINKKNSKALNMLGNSFHRLDEFEKAEDYFKKAIVINPKNVEPYFNLGNLYKDNNRFNQSIEFYKKSIAIKPKFIKSYLNLSNTYIILKDYKNAISILKAALDINSTYPNIYKNLGIIHYEIGEYEKAIEFNILFLDFEPHNRQALFNLSLILSKYCPENIDNKLSTIILKILNTYGICRPNFIIKSILSNMVNDSPFKDYKVKKIEKTDKCEEFLSELINKKIFLKFMEITPIPFLFFENLLTTIRKSILVNLQSFKNLKTLIIFQSILAKHCYVNEYIFYSSKNEKKLIKKLEKILINTNPKNYYNSESLLCLASYCCLNSLKWLDKTKICPKIKSNIIYQFDNLEIENDIIKNIPSLNNIRNETSKVVKNLYEENPYPRWENTLLIEKPITIEQLAFDLNLNVNKTAFIKSPKILIAGCGTGQHAIMSSSRFLESNVLAIDLSFKSLSYAIRKTSELGLNNIRYMQADINENFNLTSKFDIIESVGVLHHMDDPTKGWKNLLGLLKVNGLMKIGLYSQIGRERLKEVKNFILENKFTCAINFRNKLLTIDNHFISDLQNQDEFYSTSQFKDLLFHPKERHFSISEIKNILNDLNLKFCGFENPKFSQNEIFNNKSYTLEKWEQIEKNNPNLFSGMYQFWVQKV
jgi:tetratricopeptide (TPR) repeat protein